MPVRRASTAKRPALPAKAIRPEDIPLEDEPISAEEEREARLGKRDFEQGRFVGWEEVKRELGRRAGAKSAPVAQTHGGRRRSSSQRRDRRNAREPTRG